jgi:hypothetical protein
MTARELSSGGTDMSETATFHRVTELGSNRKAIVGFIDSGIHANRVAR